MSEQKVSSYGCLYCRTAASFKGDTARMPKTCPTLTQAELVQDVKPYREEPIQHLMQISDHTPFTPEGRLRNRVEELIDFAQGMGYKKIGIAFCVTLMSEAQTLAKILIDADLDAVPVCCRVGAVDYSEINLPKAHPDRFAAICNPIAQAKLLNLAKCDLIVQVGLCLGHDIILQQTCQAPVTTLIVKDRALDHNPVQALR